jgi:menaquinol-cytochrome c reductase iron-sulfur subunit
MGEPDRSQATQGTYVTQVSRRRVLVLLGSGGTLVATGGLGALLAACSAPPSAAPATTVTLAIDPTTLAPEQPVEVPFSAQAADGTTISGSTWLVKAADGTLTAFDPRCTHQQCAYAWSAQQDQFLCPCHPGVFAIDGSVVSGPPPRPLDRFPARVTGSAIQIDVPGTFATPRASA